MKKTTEITTEWPGLPRFKGGILFTDSHGDILKGTMGDTITAFEFRCFDEARPFLLTVRTVQGTKLEVPMSFITGRAVRYGLEESIERLKRLPDRYHELRSCKQHKYDLIVSDGYNEPRPLTVSIEAVPKYGYSWMDLDCGSVHALLLLTVAYAEAGAMDLDRGTKELERQARAGGRPTYI